MTESTQAKLCELYVRTAEKALQEGNFQRAEKLLTTALIDQQELLNEPKFFIAQLQQRLANMYRQERRYTEADDLYSQSTTTLSGEQTEPRVHYSMAAILEDYAVSMCEQGRFEEAAGFRSQAIGIYENNLPNDRPLIQKLRRRLAATYLAAQQYEKAEALYIAVQQTIEPLYGAEHPETTEILNQLALTYYLQGEYQKAEELYSKTYALQQSQGDPQATWTANELGLALCAQGKHSQAQPFCKQALEVRQVLGDKLYESESEQIANAISELADVYCEKNCFAEASPLCRQALGCRIHLPIEQPFDYAGRMRFYAYLLRKSNNNSDAERIETNANSYQTNEDGK